MQILRLRPVAVGTASWAVTRPRWLSQLRQRSRPPRPQPVRDRRRALRLTMMAFGALAALNWAKPCPRLRTSQGAWTRGFPARGDKNFETGVCELEPQSPDCYPEGERCSRESQTCGPDPTPDFGGCYSPSGPRKRASLDSARALSSSSTCSHDGECGLADYGKRCDRYRVGPAGPSVYYRAWEKDHDPMRSGSGDLLCGCVSGRCRFFSQ
jgi:hypothetical protein